MAPVQSPPTQPAEGNRRIRKVSSASSDSSESSSATTRSPFQQQPPMPQRRSPGLQHPNASTSSLQNFSRPAPARSTTNEMPGKQPDAGSTFHGHGGHRRQHSQGYFEPSLPTTTNNAMSALSASQAAAQAAMHVQNNQHNRKRSTTVPDPNQAANTSRPPPVPALNTAQVSGQQPVQYQHGVAGGHQAAATTAANAAFPRSPLASPPPTFSATQPHAPSPPPTLESKTGKEKSKMKLFSKPKNIGISKEKEAFNQRHPPLPSPNKLPGAGLGRMMMMNSSTPTLVDSQSSGSFAPSLYSMQNSSQSTLVPSERDRGGSYGEKDKEKKHHFLSRPKIKDLPLSSAASNSRPTDPNDPQPLYSFAAPSPPAHSSTFAKSVSGLDLRHGGRALREKKKEEKAIALAPPMGIAEGFREREPSFSQERPDRSGLGLQYGPPATGMTGAPSHTTLPGAGPTQSVPIPSGVYISHCGSDSTTFSFDTHNDSDGEKRGFPLDVFDLSPPKIPNLHQRPPRLPSHSTTHSSALTGPRSAPLSIEGSSWDDYKPLNPSRLRACSYPPEHSFGFLGSVEETTPKSDPITAESLLLYDHFILTNPNEVADGRFLSSGIASLGASFGVNGMNQDDAWPIFKARLMTIFDGQDPRPPIEDFNGLLHIFIWQAIKQRDPSMVVEEVRNFIQTGFATLDQGLRHVPEDRLIPRLVEMWLSVHTKIIPFLTAAFMPLDLEFQGEGTLMTQDEAASFWGALPGRNSPDRADGSEPFLLGESLNVNDMALSSFRDQIILSRFDTLIKLFSRISLENLNTAAAPSPDARPGTSTSNDVIAASYNSQGSTLLDSASASAVGRSRATSNTSAGSFHSNPRSPPSAQAQMLAPTSANVTDIAGKMFQCLSIISSLRTDDSGQARINRLNSEFKHNWLGGGRTGGRREGIVGTRMPRGLSGLNTMQIATAS